jgi:hypothetical protein
MIRKHVPRGEGVLSTNYAQSVLISEGIEGGGK